MIQRSLAKRLWYAALRLGCRFLAVILFCIRCHDRQLEPGESGVLVLANHQSLLDPILVGLACQRRLNYLARETLFRFVPLRWLIHSLDAIPIDLDGSGFSGLKETLRRLKHREMVLLFPEGTRTHNGEVLALKPGFCTLARRARVPLLPIGIDGAFEAWPRTTWFPSLGVINIQFGQPIHPDEVAGYSDAQLVAVVEQQICAVHAEARRRRLLAIAWPRPKRPAS